MFVKDKNSSIFPVDYNLRFITAINTVNTINIYQSMFQYVIVPVLLFPAFTVFWTSKHFTFVIRLFRYALYVVHNVMSSLINFFAHLKSQYVMKQKYYCEHTNRMVPNANSHACLKCFFSYKIPLLYEYEWNISSHYDRNILKYDLNLWPHCIN